MVRRLLTWGSGIATVQWFLSVIASPLLIAAIALVGASLSQGGEAFALRADLPYLARRSSPVTHQVDFRVVVTPPYHTQRLRVWLPIPTSDAGQTISHSEFSTFPVEVLPQIASEPRFGNRFAYFEFDHPEGAQIISHRFTAQVWQLDWDVHAETVDSVAQWPESFAPYLQPPALAHQAELTALLRELVPGPRHAGADLRTVFDWIDSHLTYDHVHASLQADADHALAERRGHCSDYHSLCAAMGQTLGYPTRVTYGLNLYPKHSPSHCKLEVFLPPHGWVSFDLSETQRLVAAIAKDPALSADRRAVLTQAARDRLYRGFRENSWLWQTRGVGYDLAPPAARPVRIVRTIYAEADGVPLPEPDPANSEAREFSWMTAHRFTADRPFTRPFQDWTTLEP